MKMYRPFSLLFILAALALLLTACTMSPAEQFIQGSWAAGNVHYWAEWNFADGQYSYLYTYVVNTPNAYETGNYSVVESGEDYIVIELYNREGNRMELGFEDQEMRITFDPQGNTIHIQRSDYTRVTASSLEALTTAQAP